MPSNLLFFRYTHDNVSKGISDRNVQNFVHRTMSTNCVKSNFLHFTENQGLTPLKGSWSPSTAS